MENTQPSYYGILPAEIRYDKRLSGNQKVFYTEITSLSNKTGQCWASNKYFAKLYGVSETSVSLWVKKLKDLGYIDCFIDKEKGNIRYITIKVNLNTYLSKVKDPYLSKLKDNNTSNNNKNNKRENPQTLKEITLEEKRELSKKYNCSVSQIDEKIETLIAWCGANGKTYKNYKMALQNWLLRDYGLRQIDYLKC
jgi:DNA-binding transcriptional ArsR family regulator